MTNMTSRTILNPLGFTSGVLLLVSGFLPWFSGYSAIQLANLESLIPQYITYISPVTSGIVCILGMVVLTLKRDKVLQGVLVLVVSAGVLLVFFVDFLQLDNVYVSTIEVGFYVCLVGTVLEFACIFLLLSTMGVWNDSGGQAN
ncbi:MAG: hypothetical protein ACTSU5_17440 [Promethearchaeota archaeon]